MIFRSILAALALVTVLTSHADDFRGEAEFLAREIVTRLERETDALFVGEPTVGSPNHFGDANFARAERSGLPYIVSTLRWQDMPPFDERTWILPDVPAPPRFEDFLAGRDLALELAQAHELKDGIDWVLRTVQPWARDSQQATWRFFFELPEPPAGSGPD